MPCFVHWSFQIRSKQNRKLSHVFGYVHSRRISIALGSIVCAFNTIRTGEAEAKSRISECVQGFVAADEYSTYRVLAKSAGGTCQAHDHSVSENCNTDTDCSSHGKCIEVGGSSYPKKRCFCAAGWLGNTCDRGAVSTVTCLTESDFEYRSFPASPLRVRLFNKMYYSHQNLAEGFDLYWLIDQNLAEIEIIVQSKSLSWIAIGWRPSGKWRKHRLTLTVFRV